MNGKNLNRFKSFIIYLLDKRIKMSFFRAYKSCVACSHYHGLSESLSEPKDELEVQERKTYLQLRDRSSSYAMKALEEIHGGSNSDLPAFLLNQCALCDSSSPSIGNILESKDIIKRGN